MKEHILRELVNDLRDIGIQYHAHGCLRELIGNRVQQALQADAQWHRKYLAEKFPDMTIKA